MRREAAFGLRSADVPAPEAGLTDSRDQEITAVLVSWRDTAEIEASIQALAAARARLPEGGPRASLIVVDNGGDLAHSSWITELWPDALLIVNAQNRGFAAGANQAAHAARGDVLLFLNPDTRAQGDPFSEIVRGLSEHPEATALAPRLLDFDGEPPPGPTLAPPDREDQRTFQLRHLPTLASDARQLLLFDHLFPNNSWRRRDRYARNDRDKPFFVEQAAGAALAVRRDVFLQIAGFDEGYFPAWFEDVDLCAKLLARGPVLYWPAARFRHRGRVASETLGYARFLPIYYGSALRYRRRYALPARIAYRVLLATGMLLRLAALPLRRRMPRRRRDAAVAYVRALAVAAGLRSRRSPLP